MTTNQSYGRHEEGIIRYLRSLFLALVIGTCAAVSGGAFDTANAKSPEDLNHDANEALHLITSTNPTAADLAKKAKAVLIFPNSV